MLIIHRGDDYRVSNTQGISAFTTLKRRGIPSRMLYLFSYRKSWNTESTQFTYLPSRIYGSSLELSSIVLSLELYFCA
ncbi:unnamed protein product [Rotaria sp. Silwood1]|nr:unnamed protein product [Rotaria sp. Silwood1]